MLLGSFSRACSLLSDSSSGLIAVHTAGRLLLLLLLLQFSGPSEPGSLHIVLLK